METNNYDVPYTKYISKTMSWILRHGIIKSNLNMDSAGYVKIDDMLKLDQLKHYNLSDIQYVVNNNDKNRFKIIEKNSNLYIRANQGHCDEIGKMLNDNTMMEQITTPLPICVHGTTKKAINQIKQTGLIPMNRKHIHFTSDVDTKKVVSGIRQSSKILVFVNMKQALTDGKKFYLSDNGVILCPDTIEPKYFSKIEQI